MGKRYKSSIFEELLLGKPKKRRYKKRRKYNNDIGAHEVMIIFSAFLILGLGVNFYKTNPGLFYFIVILIVLGVFLIVLLQNKAKHEKYMNIKTLEDMKNLRWREFEKFIEFVFRKKGFKANTRQGRNDGGIDLDAKLNGQKYLIQCKKRDKYKIGVTQLREFFGVVRMMGDDYKGIYITTGKLTKEAINEFKKIENYIELWDFSNLEEYIKQFKGLENHEINNNQKSNESSENNND